MGVQAPSQFELLQTLNEEPPAIVKMMTVEEKIKSNFYKCNTDIEWIRADNAQCLAKPIQTVQTVNNATQAQKTVRGAENSSGNTYTPGQCTHWTKSVLGWVPNGWGDATNWAANAKADGYSVVSVPKVGAVAWRYGHVAAVIGVGNGTVTVSEANYRWVPYETRVVTIPTDTYSYIY